MMGDTHIYANHVEPLKEQLQNKPRHFPVSGGANHGMEYSAPRPCVTALPGICGSSCCFLLVDLCTGVRTRLTHERGGQALMQWFFRSVGTPLCDTFIRHLVRKIKDLGMCAIDFDQVQVVLHAVCTDQPLHL